MIQKGFNMIFTLTVPQMIVIIAALIIIIWRAYYGYQNGVLEETAGVIALIAALTALYLAMDIAKDVSDHSFMNILTKVIYFVIAIVIYKVGHLIGRALRPIRNIPIISQANSILGALLGFIEAYILILLIEKIIGIEIISLLQSIITELYTIVRKYITNL